MYPNRILTPGLVLSIIIIMGMVFYLNQEVPACINSASTTVQPVLNYSDSTIAKIDNQLESNVLIFETEGNSMEPLISSGERCVCEKDVTYSVGDLVIFFASTGNGYEGIAHKIISINATSGEIVTKGTNNQEADYPINQENILCFIPYTKRINLL